MAKFQAPQGTTSVSVGGAQYNTDEKGQFEAPDNLAAILLPNGFSRVAANPPAKPAASTKAPAAPVVAAEAPVADGEPVATASKGSRKAEGGSGAG